YPIAIFPRTGHSRPQPRGTTPPDRRLARVGGRAQSSRRGSIQRPRTEFGVYWDHVTFGQTGPTRQTLRLKIAALLQPGDRFAHHAMAEMALANAQQFRAMPFLMDRLNFLSRRDRIEFAGHEKNASGIASWLTVQR